MLRVHRPGGAAPPAFAEIVLEQQREAPCCTNDVSKGWACRKALKDGDGMDKVERSGNEGRPDTAPASQVLKEVQAEAGGDKVAVGPHRFMSQSVITFERVLPSRIPSMSHLTSDLLGG